MDSIPGPYAIQTALSCWSATRARLLMEDTDLAGDEQQLAALLGAETTDLAEIEASLARAIVTASAMADTADTLAANVIARRDRYRRRVQSYKATLFAILDAVGARRFEAPDVTVSISLGRAAVVVTDEAALPERFWRTETTRKVDKAALREALADGEVIEGATCSNGPPVLTIRSK